MSDWIPNFAYSLPYLQALTSTLLQKTTSIFLASIYTYLHEHFGKHTNHNFSSFLNTLATTLVRGSGSWCKSYFFPNILYTGWVCRYYLSSWRRPRPLTHPCDWVWHGRDLNGRVSLRWRVWARLWVQHGRSLHPGSSGLWDFSLRLLLLAGTNLAFLPFGKYYITFVWH